ncbi:MAG: hypothetical protein ACLPXB_19215 [Thiobacillaceae bacterium]
MNQGNGRVNAVKTVGLALALGISMSACSATKSWEEEVLLHDGQKMVIERHFNLGPATIESTERKELDETITFTPPGSNSKITWRTEFNDTTPEPNDLSIQLLDVVKGTPYIAARPAGCIGFNKWKRPNPPYIFFKYAGGVWNHISMDEFPAVLIKINVIVGSPPTDLLKSFYTFEQVNEQNQDIRAEGYKTIIRKPFAIEENRCPNLVRIEGGWLSVDWFTDQPSLDACLKFCTRKKVNTDSCPCRSIFDGK